MDVNKRPRLVISWHDTTSKYIKIYAYIKHVYILYIYTYTYKRTYIIYAYTPTRNHEQTWFRIGSVALHRANARSILTRPFHTPQPVHAPAVFARATLTAAQAQQAAHSQSISEQMAF